MYMSDFLFIDLPAQQTVENLRLLNWVLQWHGTPYVSRVKLAEAQVEGSIREIQLASFAEGNLFNPPYLQVFGENKTYTSESKIPWRCAGQFDDLDASIEGTYLCLLLFSTTRATSVRSQYEIVESFLIIERVEELHDCTRYRRVGSARIWGEVPTFDSAETRSLILV